MQDGATVPIYYESRLAKLALDIVEHFEKRLEAMDGKALEAGFLRISLINGRQLVDLLIEHWGDMPPEFGERLGLKRGLVRT